jgi:transcriptional regulator with XRE-family HTH domain
MKHDISQRQFALMCGLSNGTISNLEKGVNPNNGKPITPKLEQIRKIASAMGLSVTELLEKADDMPIDISDDNERRNENVVPFSISEDINIIRIAGRDGSYREHHLDDRQFADLLAYLDSLPDASDDL